MATCRPCKGGKRLTPRERAEQKAVEQERIAKAEQIANSK